MTNHTFTILSSGQIEYNDGARKTHFNFDLDAPVLYIQFKLFDRWAEPNNEEIDRITQSEIADRFYDFLIELGKDERKVVIYDKLMPPPTMPKPPENIVKKFFRWLGHR